MQYRKLGKTGIDVSLICLGTMTFGKQNTQHEGFEQMDYALEHGVNFFDTAELYAIPPSPQTYGKTETIIGNWFAQRKNRDKVILATKAAGPGPTWIRKGTNRLDKKNLTEALEGSLQRLQTDYIDLYQLHWPNRPNFFFGRHWSYTPEGVETTVETENFIEVLETLAGMIKAGKIRHFGLSNESAWGAMNYLKLSEARGLPRAVSIQNEYNLLNRHFDLDLAEVAMREEIGLLAWSPLATGMLTGKYLDGQIPEGSRWSLPQKHNYRNKKRAHMAVKAYLKIAQTHELDPAQMALAYVNSRPFVTSNIIGATSLKQLENNINSIKVDLSEEVIAEINHTRTNYAIVY